MVKSGSKWLAADLLALVIPDLHTGRRPSPTSRARRIGGRPVPRPDAVPDQREAPDQGDMPAQRDVPAAPVTSAKPVTNAKPATVAKPVSASAPPPVRVRDLTTRRAGVSARGSRPGCWGSPS